MRHTRTDTPRRTWLGFALGAFLIVAFAAVIVNSFCLGHGLDFGRSISRYVGFEVWSALAFSPVCVFAAGATGVFLWKLGQRWEMPRVYYYCVLLMSAGLIFLSLFPIGLCDPVGSKSIVSFAHEISSRTMFLMMLATAAMLTVSRHAAVYSRRVSLVFVIYGVICVTGYFSHGAWFESCILLFETAYIAGFVAILLMQKNRSEPDE